MDDGNNTNNKREKLIDAALAFFRKQKKSSWSNKLLWISITTFTHIMITKLLAPALDEWYNQKERDWQMIKDLIHLNEDLEKLIDDMEDNHYNIRLRKKMEKHYEERKLKIMKLEKEFWEKYLNKAK